MGCRVRLRPRGCCMQGLEYFSGTFDWPRQIQQLSTLALLIGLPIVLVLAWYHGDRGEQRIRGTELTIVALLLLLGGGIVWYYQHALETSTVATPAAPSAPAIPTDASIAVLPFANMSGDPADEYFSDGLAEELLNSLTRIDGLKVAARTTSFQYKDRTGDVSEIARQASGRPHPGRQCAPLGLARASHRPADQGQRRLSPVVRELRPGAPGHLRGPIGHRGPNRGEVACRVGPTTDHERYRGIRSAAAGPSPDAAAERAGAARVPQAARAGSRSRPEIRGGVVCIGHCAESASDVCVGPTGDTLEKPRRRRAGRSSSIPAWRSR